MTAHEYTDRSGPTPLAGPAAPRRADLLALLLLLALTALAWITARGLWDAGAWNLPLTYVDPIYSDFIGASAFVKAMTEGHGVPFGWKSCPALGAPGEVNWTGTPTPEESLFFLLWLFSRACGLFRGINLVVLVGHLAAAASFFLVARHGFGCRTPWAFVGGLAFGLAPFFFAQSPHHIACQYAWHLPLCVLVWTWVASGTGLSWGSRRLWQALAIALVTGMQSPYFSNVFCQLVILGGAVHAWRSRSWEAMKPVVAIVGAVALGFFVSNLDTFAYRLTHAAQAGTMIGQREYRWMDIYGFKVVDLFMPWITHRSEAFAKFGLAHRQSSVLNDEEGCAYLGLLGIGCLLLLVATAVRALVEGRTQDVPREFWWVAWIVIFFNTGGLNSLIAAFTGFTLFRTAVRYSVVVLAIVLLYAARRLSDWERAAAARSPDDTLRIVTATAVGVACLLVLWDQVPRAPTAQQTAAIARAMQSDRDFVGRLEAALPPDSMVFQLPVSDGSAQNGLTGSDHYRPYLYSTSLHWSHGAIPGTDALQWQQSVQQTLLEGAASDPQARQIRFRVDNVRKAVDEMRRTGFAAISINRNGFPDRGKGLEEALLELGYDKPPIRSEAGDLTGILLE
jgi:hypothetical protein